MQTRSDRKKLNKTLQFISEQNRNRIIFIGIVFTVILSFLVYRLAVIQIVDGEMYRTKAMRQWFKEIPIGVERGKIYDRNMHLLTNRDSARYLIIFPDIFPNTEENLQLISEITKISTIELKYENLVSNRPIQVKIKNEDEELIKKLFNIKGVYPMDIKDRYNSNSYASHVIGYVNKIDNVGSKGLELKYDKILKENQMYKIGAIVDAQKKTIPGLGYQVIQDQGKENKKNLVTTLDYDVQEIVEAEMDKINKKGSIVVLQVRTGEVVSMVSRPNFNQNNVALHLESTEEELFNRGIQVAYPPGSIFKIVVAAAVLENNIVTEQEKFFCNGYEEINGIRIKCNSFEKGGHGELNFEEAFSLSCNSVFIQLGQRVGAQKIIEMSQRFGLGSLTNVGLPEEVEGKLPTEDYMKGAGIGNISIGQGIIEATPIQMAQVTSIIANQGTRRSLNIIKKIINDNNEVIQDSEIKPPIQILTKKTAKKIQNLMTKVVLEGTGRQIDMDDIGGAAGKTGSAQGSLQGKEVVHAWFTGYFPIKDPTYVITILIEDGGSGGGVAAPIFNNIARRINEIERHK